MLFIFINNIMKLIINFFDLLTLIVILFFYKLALMTHIFCVIAGFISLFLTVIFWIYYKNQNQTLFNIIIIFLMYFGVILSQQLAAIIEVYYLANLGESNNDSK